MKTRLCLPENQPKFIIHHYQKLYFMKPPRQTVPGNGQGPPLTPGDRWLNKEQVLALLYISDRTLQHWRTNRILPYSRIGNKLYYRLSDIGEIAGEPQGAGVRGTLELRLL